MSVFQTQKHEDAAAALQSIRIKIYTRNVATFQCQYRGITERSIPDIGFTTQGFDLKGPKMQQVFHSCLYIRKE